MISDNQKKLLLLWNLDTILFTGKSITNELLELLNINAIVFCDHFHTLWKSYSSVHKKTMFRKVIFKVQFYKQLIILRNIGIDMKPLQEKRSV